MKPLVLIPCDVKDVKGHPTHCVGEKYINAVSHGADVAPLLLPAIGPGQDLDSLEQQINLDEILDLVSGVVLTGSVSNVDPLRYGGISDPKNQGADLQRDTTVFSLIDKAIARKVPLLAICRGIQELNVAFGGTLYTAVQDVGKYMDHREKSDVPRHMQYEPVHEVMLRQGGRLREILQADTVMVNSLHGQGINKLGDGLVVEAVAPDGLIEAVSLPGQFVLGVQWHPEWEFAESPVSKAIFAAFGEAVREYSNQR